MNLILIAIGGALGSVLRYLSSETAMRIAKILQLPCNFPWGTFFVNVSGSLVAGVVYYFLVRNFANFDPRLKNFLIIGVLGGFTTFSAFSLDFFRLMSAGQHLQAFAYVTLSVSVALLAVFCGFYLTKIIFS